jgi:hypothetical protein
MGSAQGLPTGVFRQTGKVSLIQDFDGGLPAALSLASNSAFLLGLHL